MFFRPILLMAALAACSSSFAQGSQVRLFGVVDAFVESARTGQGTINRLGSGGLYSTRWGISGSEDLGGGLKAGFLLESLFNTDTGAVGSGGKFFGRTASVGLESTRFGKIDAGRMATQVLDTFVMFSMARYGAGNFVYNPNVTFTHDNALRYTSPALGPVVFQAQYHFGEVAGSSAGRTVSAMATYRQQRALVTLGVTRSNAPVDITAAGDGVTIVTAGAFYDFGFVRPLVLFEGVRSRLTPRLIDQHMVNLGAEVPLGPGSLRLEYEFVKDKAHANRDANAISARYDYPLSKRTIIYAGATRIHNDSDVYYPIVGASGSSPIAFPIPSAYNGTSPSSLILGITHIF